MDPIMIEEIGDMIDEAKVIINETKEAVTAVKRVNTVKSLVPIGLNGSDALTGKDDSLLFEASDIIICPLYGSESLTRGTKASFIVRTQSNNTLGISTDNAVEFMVRLYDDNGEILEERTYSIYVTTPARDVTTLEKSYDISLPSGIRISKMSVYAKVTKRSSLASNIWVYFSPVPYTSEAYRVNN